MTPRTWKLQIVLVFFGAALIHVGLSQEEFEAADMNDVHFLLWTNDDPHNFNEIIIDDVSSLFRSGFNNRLPIHVLVHGWLDNGTSGWIVEAKTELLDLYDCDVIAIDWGKIAENLYYPTVTRNVPAVGQHAAKFLDFLHGVFGRHIITSIHVTGHSLGAHVAGFMGKNVINGPIGRITGLDPAGPEYNTVSPDKRLSSSDANFVGIIHTNGCSPYLFCAGIDKEIGDVDYYPNGGARQPGCITNQQVELELTIGCNHQRSHAYWIESINGQVPFKSEPCPDWDTYKAGGCPDCGQGCLDMGLHAFTGLTGKYFLKTNAEKPYAVHPQTHPHRDFLIQI